MLRVARMDPDRPRLSLQVPGPPRLRNSKLAPPHGQFKDIRNFDACARREAPFAAAVEDTVAIDCLILLVRIAAVVQVPTPSPPLHPAPPRPAPPPGPRSNRTDCSRLTRPPVRPVRAQEIASARSSTYFLGGFAAARAAELAITRELRWPAEAFTRARALSHFAAALAVLGLRSRSEAFLDAATRLADSVDDNAARASVLAVRTPSGPKSAFSGN
eukprot:tig00000194_g14824.t1